MNDKVKLTMAVLSLALAVILPLALLFLVWLQWDLQTGIIVGFLSFGVFLFLGVGFLFSVRNLNWFGASLPYLFSSLYAILPDVFLGAIDDSAAVVIGAIFSYALEMRRNSNAPKWVIVFPLLAAIYLLIGGFFPGPLDELVVSGLLYIAYAFSTSKSESDQVSAQLRGEKFG